MAEIILHIGLNKTGTSSIQDLLSMNAEPLAKQGVVYPETGRMGTAHHNVAKWLKKLGPNADPRKEETGKALLAEFKKTPRVVMSSEELHTLTNRGVEHFAQLLDGHDVKVYLYVRDHLRYMASWYQQSIQSTHLSLSFDKFCDFAQAPFMAIADRWAEHFGQRGVHLRVYDRAHLRNKDVVSDLMYESLGIDDLSGFTRKPRDSNPSLTGNLLFFKRVINNFLTKQEAGGVLANECTALARLDESFSGSILVDDHIAKFVSNLYAGDRVKLEKKYGVVFPPAGKPSGVLVPDFSRMTEDWEKVKRHAKTKNFRIAGYFDLIESINPGVLGDAAVTTARPSAAAAPAAGASDERIARLEQEQRVLREALADLRKRHDSLEAKLLKLAVH